MVRLNVAQASSLRVPNERSEALHPIPMTVTVNGKSHTLNHGTTLAALVEQLNFGPKRLAIEVNKELVTRTEWASCILKDGDSIEIVSFVGGG